MQTAQIMVEQWKAVGLNVASEMKENWGQILGRFPGGGICENSNSSWFDDPVASLSAYTPGGPDLGGEPVEMIGLMAALQDSTDTDKRRDYRWRPAQSFVVDFRASNLG